MRVNQKKLEDSAVQEFMPLAEQLLKEGWSQNDILKLYQTHIYLRTRHLYSNPLSIPKMKNSELLAAYRKELGKADSKAEKILFDLLVQNGIKFKFQYPIGKYRIDFLVDNTLVVELDGPHHQKQKEYDAKRDSYFEGLGYCVLRIPLTLLALTPDAVIEEIKEQSKVIPIRRSK